MPGPKELHARPICALCRKPVESFTEEEGTGALRGFVLFVARCHGDVERQKVGRGDTRGLNFGAAFASNLLAGSPTPRSLPPIPGDRRT